MDNSIKKLPAGEVKKKLLDGRLTFDSLDEETILRLLDYETDIFVNDIGETRFYRMCLKALSRFADFRAEDVTADNISEVSESVYFLCFGKRQRRKWNKMLKKEKRRKRLPERTMALGGGSFHRAAVLVLLVVWLYTGQSLIYSEYNPFWGSVSRIRELFELPYGETVKRGDDDIQFGGEIREYASYEELSGVLDADILHSDSDAPSFAVKGIWYTEDSGHRYVKIRYEAIEMGIYLDHSPFEESCFQTDPEPMDGGYYYWLSSTGYYQAVIFREDAVYSIVSPDAELLRAFLITLKK